MHVIVGGRAAISIGAHTIDVERAGEESSAVDAVVIEEDTYLTLSAAAHVNADREVPQRERLTTLTHGFGAEPAELGTLVLRQGRPLTMLAVVVDVDADPPVDAAHVQRAYERALAVCRAQSLHKLRVPLLGRHGRFDLHESARLLSAALRAHEGEALLLLVPHPPADADRLRDALRALSN
jgi:hypothetical protein